MAEGKTRNAVFEALKTIFFALLIAGIFRTLFFQPFWIPSGSMKDTLLIGDFLFVNKMAYGYSYASCPSVVISRIGIDIDARDLCGFLEQDDNGRILGTPPERGDVAVFRHPVSGRDFIKRVVGLPGDRIQMRGGVLHINDTPVQLEAAGTFEEVAGPQGPFGHRPQCANGPVGDGGSCLKTRLRETLPNGESHFILDVGPRGADNTPVFTVPVNNYFMMGDNRDNSTDSRFPTIAGGVGFVPFDHLIGRADRVILSSAGRMIVFFWTWRGDRFYEKIE